MAGEKSNKRLYQLVGIVIVLAVALMAVIYFYQAKVKPPVDIEAEVPPGINHIKSIYGPRAGDNFDKPESTALDNDGNIYVADTGNHRIAIFDSDGNFERIIGSEKDTPFPLGIAVGKNGNIYVTSLMKKQLIILSKEGKVKKVIKFKKKETVPLRVLVDGNKLYITSVGQIAVADLNGKIETDWGKEGRALGSFRYPNGILVGKIGKFGKSILISDSNNNRVQIFSLKKGKPTLKAYLGKPPKSLKDTDLKFGLPMGATLDDQGRIYIVDAFNHSVRILDNDGNDIAELGKQGSADGRYHYPTDIKHISGNQFIIADKWNDRIQICELSPGEVKKGK